MTHVSRCVKRKVESTVGEFDEVILNAFAVGQLAWVDEIRRAKLACPLFLCRIHVDGDHAGRPDEIGRVDAAQADAAAAKDRNRRTL